MIGVYKYLRVDGSFSITLIYFMHKEQPLKTFAAACMLVLFLVVSFVSSEGTLLCFGKDGHVAVEFVDACNGSDLGSQLAGMESDACGPCKDVQFLSSPAYTRNVSHHTQALSPISSSPVSPSLPLKLYSNKHINPPEYSHDTTLASLHSVILLI
jgi:hypothetical protein